jgi:hypothetical protein
MLLDVIRTAFILRGPLFATKRKRQSIRLPLFFLTNSFKLQVIGLQLKAYSCKLLVNWLAACS